MPSVEWKGSAHPYRENQIPRLDDAHRLGQFVKVTCTWCHPRRVLYFRPLDIIRLIEDRHVLKLQRCFRCQRCKRNDYMEVSFKAVMGDELKGMVIRELVEVKMVKRPVWRDKKL